MAHHWQSQNVKRSGVDDMVLLNKVANDAIADNLKKRFSDNCIYTYIGPVLIAVNPYKKLGIYSRTEMGLYYQAQLYENAPHIFAIADHMYRNMITDKEGQCVIISGESGAGKTVSAKHIMNYISEISGGATNVIAQQVKKVILESNPLLEAFGNAKTVRNNNSSRFGKYVDMHFDLGGVPVGGKIMNFLLEKSRVVATGLLERCFHIFYQLMHLDAAWKEALGLSNCEAFYYLNQSGEYQVDGVNDAADLQLTIAALNTMQADGSVVSEVLRVTAAVLHLGNIEFTEVNNKAKVRTPSLLTMPAHLLNIDSKVLETKLTSRVMDSKWGGKTEKIDVELNQVQAEHTRDALAKAIYSRLFNYLVQCVNNAMSTTKACATNLGILDIYGFEIFEQNGFEQFCINFVNEKLQQIFIELTLKAEQEEYSKEGIKWTPIDFFNNKVVCDLIESKQPPGIFCILDDVCATLHAVTEGADAKFLDKVRGVVGNHHHYAPAPNGFRITHYAGDVAYNSTNFCEKNRDILFPDLIEMLQRSGSSFVLGLFPEQISDADRRRPLTGASQIRTQTGELVKRLTQCAPHYIRCIKPNHLQKSGLFEADLVLHQVTYLGLCENVRVRRAGFAFRREFDKFLLRYAILTGQPQRKPSAAAREAVQSLLERNGVGSDQYQMGKTKVFIKSPESLFMLEEVRERKYGQYAKIIQKAWRRFSGNKRDRTLLDEVYQMYNARRQRNRATLNRRHFYYDYLNLSQNLQLHSLVGGRMEQVAFAIVAQKYNRDFSVHLRSVLVTTRGLFFIGRQPVKVDKKTVIQDVLKRRIAFAEIQSLTLSPYTDGFVVVNVVGQFSSVINIEKFARSEFLYAMWKKFAEATGNSLPLDFVTEATYPVEVKGVIQRMGGNTRKIRFQLGAAEQVKKDGKCLVVTCESGERGDVRPLTLGAPNYKLPSGLQLKPSGGGGRGRGQGGASRVGGGGGGAQRLSENRGAQLQPPMGVPQLLRQVSPPAAGAQGRARRVSVEDRERVLSVLGASRAPASPPPAAAPAPRPPPKPRTKRLQCRALYPYEPQDATELRLAVNDIIDVMDNSQDWWHGRLRGQQGVFPSNYVEMVP